MVLKYYNQMVEKNILLTTTWRLLIEHIPRNCAIFTSLVDVFQHKQDVEKTLEYFLFSLNELRTIHQSPNRFILASVLQLFKRNPALRSQIAPTAGIIHDILTLCTL
jgi:hypothetical protein